MARVSHSAGRSPLLNIKFGTVDLNKYPTEAQRADSKEGKEKAQSICTSGRG